MNLLIHKKSHPEINPNGFFGFRDIGIRIKIIDYLLYPNKPPFLKVRVP